MNLCKAMSLLDAILISKGYSFEQSDPDARYVSKKSHDLLDSVGKEGLYCKHCQQLITHPSSAIEVNGTHHHVFANPEGISFEIGVYDQAECLIVSPAMLEHTWFAGYTWQIVICGGCHLHLGWKYSKPGSPAFYGLIVDRLVNK